MASSLQEYLKRYTTDPHQSDDSKKKKKKKKKKETEPSLTLVDDDPLWQKEIKEPSSSEEDEQDDAPLVIKDVEVKRMQKLEALKMQRPYISISGDGSGWVTLNDVPKQTTLQKEYSSQNRHDTPEPLSPARKSLESSKVSPARKILHDNVDASPIRMTLDDDKDVSPGKRQYNRVDLSPPRKQVLQREVFSRKNPSPTRKFRGFDPDLSPPRKRKGRHDSPDSYPTRREHDTDDLLPSKSNKIKHISPDLSPPRRCKGRHDSPDSSLQHDSAKHASQMQTLPRKRQQESPDVSPVRKLRHDSPDLSPPRRTNLHAGERTSRKDHPKASEVSPVRRRQYDSLDLSPPRKRRSSPQRRAAPKKSRHDDIPDLSPERKAHPDLTPPRDLSPPRKRLSLQTKTETRKSRHETPDLSPKRKGHPDLMPPKESKYETKESEMEKRKSRTVAGLQHGKHVAEEVELKKQEDARRIEKLDMSKSGKHATTVYRDKLGKRVELDDLVKLQQADKPPKEKPLEWGKGLAQKREAEAQMTELEAERLKPFARTRDDPDLDKHLRERLRWGDPMAHLVKKKTVEPVLEDFGEMKQMKESGFIVPQDIPKHSWLKLGITPPPNRYGIKPGRHWDGVDRSNGFEKEMYKKQNEKKADQIEAYLWSVADM